KGILVTHRYLNQRVKMLRNNGCLSVPMERRAPQHRGLVLAHQWVRRAPTPAAELGSDCVEPSARQRSSQHRNFFEISQSAIMRECQDWTFTALNPSSEMLRQAKIRLEAVRALDRAIWIPRHHRELTSRAFRRRNSVFDVEFGAARKEARHIGG